MSAAREALAPAKVNLFLHVGAPDAVGYHPVCSLAVFADVGDVLTVTPAAAPSLEVTGPFAGRAGPDADNLVSRALAALGGPPLAVRLDKRLPVAAGLGGGSSDAGAALRLARPLAAPQMDDAALEALAADLGADGAVCLWARAALCEGRGERLLPAPALPPIPAVLVNPGVDCPTGAVYRAYDAGPGPFRADRPDLPAAFETVEALAAFLSGCRNDLEPAAVGLRPQIGDVLAWLKGRPETLLARMSGSGATAFALCRSEAEARRLAADAAAARPGWWTAACRLG